MPQYTETNIATHDLGYCPFFLVFRASGSALFLSGDIMDAWTTTSEIRFRNYQPSTVTHTFYTLICRNRLDKDIVTPVFQTQSREAALSNRDYGLITSKDGKSTDSEDMRDFTFHSDTRALLVHRVAAAEMNAATNNRLEWKNDLPYRPIWFAFVSIDSGATYKNLYGGGQAPPISFQDDATGDVSIWSFPPQSGTQHFGSVWIFKDPFDKPATETVLIS